MTNLVPSQRLNCLNYMPWIRKMSYDCDYTVHKTFGFVFLLPSGTERYEKCFKMF